MKILSAKVIVCSPGRNFVTLKIETDEGIYGLGDATLNGRELAVVSYLQDHLIPCLIGRESTLRQPAAVAAQPGVDLLQPNARSLGLSERASFFGLSERL